MLNFGVDAFYVNPGEELLGVEAEVFLTFLNGRYFEI
jgi:hypothetical protein